MTVLFKEFKSPSSDQLRGSMTVNSANIADYPGVASYLDAFSAAVTLLQSSNTKAGKSIVQLAAMAIAVKIFNLEIARIDGTVP